MPETLIWTGLAATSPDRSGFDPEAIRADFPILSRRVGEWPLVYLDSANTSQKPTAVVDAVAEHYLAHNANIARAMHTLGVEATQAYQGARAKVAAFIGSDNPDEVVFTKNASEALNLAAHTLGAGLQPGDEIVISVLEHHSNIVPWQLAAERSGATLRWFELTAGGELDLERARAEGLINDRTKVVSLAWVSNVLGTINPLSEISDWAHHHGAVLVVDASQGVPHLPTSVSDLGADLLVFTGHKMLGPTGVGVLWGRYDLLESLPPFLGGGEMIEVVRMTGSTYARPPHRFEAGTPPIAQVVGLGAAIDYLEAIGMERVAARDRQLASALLGRLQQVAGVQVLGPTDPAVRGALVSFTLATSDGLEIHPHDVMQLLDSRGVAIRGGHHCARPLHEALGLTASNRASAYLYTTEAEIEALAVGLDYVRDFFSGALR